MSHALLRDRAAPDSVCFCSKQDCGDREEFFDYLDAAVGVYRDAKLLRFVFGLSDAPEGTFDIRTVDEDIASIRKIILRKRSTPPWQSPVRDRDDNYNYYDFYYQTRIYTATNAHYAPRGEESRIRLIDAQYVCDWLCENTGLKAENDTQAQPLDGYPEGV